MIRLNWAGCVLAGLGLAICSAEGAGQAKAAVPSKEAQAESDARIRKQLAGRFSAAESRTEKAGLGFYLYQTAMETELELVDRYVFLMLARDISMEAGAPVTALDAVREVARAYNVDDLALEQEVLLGASRQDDVDRHFLAEEALILADRAVDQDRFEIATNMVVLAREAGVEGDRYRQVADHVQSRRAAFQEVEESLEGLADNPEDPQLNLIVGEYRCFVQGRWEEGLPLLAKGSDAVLSGIATADLRNPRDEDQKVVADEWLRIAEGRRDPERTILGRAIYWYGQVQLNSPGIARRGARDRRRVYEETTRVVAAARRLTDEGFPRFAAYWLRKAAHLDPSTIEGEIAAWSQPEDPIEEIAPLVEPPEQPAEKAPEKEVEDPVVRAVPEVVDFTIPALYSERSGGREKLPAKHSAALSAGLEWLELHQDADGMWDADEFMKHDLEGRPSDGAGSAVHDVGVTSLGLLAFLGDGSTTRSGPYRDVVKRASAWLQAQQGGSGLFGTNASHDFIYDHALATVAMCEAYALSGDRSLRAAAQLGIDYLESHRNPYAVWRYQPRDGKNDSTVTGWCVLAYKTAEHVGLEINSNAMANALKWYDSVTDDLGRAGYVGPNELSSRHPGMHGSRFPPDKGEALTAVALSSRFLLGQDPAQSPLMESGAQLILKKPPVWDEGDGSIDHYYWFYATNALHRMGGRYWQAWSSRLEAAVLDTQRTDDNFAGSWDPVGVWGEDGGRVYSTAMLVLCLEAEYRYSDTPVAVATPAVEEFPLGRLFNPLRQAWKDENLPRVHRAHRNLREEDLTEEEQLILENSEARLAVEIEKVTQEISELRSNPDYFLVHERLKEIARNFRGLDPGKEADKQMRVIMTEESTKREVTAGAALQSLLERFPPENSRARRGLINALEEFVVKRRYERTLAADKANKLLAELRR